MVHTAASGADQRRVSVLTIVLWFMAALFEGIDLQSIGIANPGIAGEFHFDPAQMGWVLTASTIGLVIGAAVGGRLADARGRKTVLVWSVVAYGVFSVVTAFTWDWPTLIAARVLTGIGLGGAIPNLVALVAESVPESRRGTMVSLMYCGMPLGSAAAAAIGWLLVGDYGWRVVFYIGGFGPVFVAPLLAAFLPESPDFASSLANARKTEGTLPTPVALFGQGRAVTTVGLWISFFFIHSVLYLMLSWLVSLLIGKGFGRADASAILVLFNLGAMGGMILSGVVLDRSARIPSTIAMYAALLIAMGALAYGSDHVLIAVAVTACGLFNAAVQIIIYSLAPGYYPTLSRGTGMGWLVAVGRSGAIAGPLVAGQLLVAGFSVNAVLVVGAPGLALALIATLLVLSRPRAVE